MNSRAPLTIGTALALLTMCQGFAAFAQGGSAPPGTPASSENTPGASEASPAKTEASPAKNEASPAKSETAPATAGTAPATAGTAPATAGTAPAKTEAAAAKTEAAQASPAKQAVPAKVEPPPTQLTCRAVRNDIGMYEPLRFMTITIDLPKKYVKMVHEGDGRVFEYKDGAPAYRSFVKITDDSVVYGQGRETWRIDRYTGNMTSSAFTIQFECQLRPAERKF